MTLRSEIFKYVQQTYNLKPDYPWSRYPGYAVLRHEGTEKWFGLIMSVPKGRLGLDGNADIEILNVKTDVDKVGSLRRMKGVLPAYHMNKEHWVSILLDGSVGLREIKSFLDESFVLTK